MNNQSVCIAEIKITFTLLNRDWDFESDMDIKKRSSSVQCEQERPLSVLSLYIYVFSIILLGSQAINLCDC